MRDREGSTFISSLQNPRIKHLLALQQKSALRRKEGLFVVEGQREFTRCLAKGYQPQSLFVCPALLTDPQGVGAVDVPLLEVSTSVYERIAYRGTTEGVMAVMQAPAHSLSQLVLPPDPLLVVLESVEKPGNLGAILRTADAAGVSAVILADALTDVYNPNVIRSSLGAVFSVQIATGNSAACIDFIQAQGIQILTAQLQDSFPYYDVSMKSGTALVMGTEDKGLSHQWRQAADAHIRIPMLGLMDSLNVSVSAAILMYEAVRQRQAR